MKITIPGRGNLEFEHVLLDYNGTIACDGILIPSVENRIKDICREGLKVHVLTADSNGTVKKQCANLPIKIQIFDNANAAKNKREIAEKLGKENCVCIGNGYNDGQMFEACALSVIVMEREGCSVSSLIKADIVCRSIEDALDLIIRPSRMIPTLRG